MLLPSKHPDSKYSLSQELVLIVPNTKFKLCIVLGSNVVNTANRHQETNFHIRRWDGRDETALFPRSWHFMNFTSTSPSQDLGHPSVNTEAPPALVFLVFFVVLQLELHILYSTTTFQHYWNGVSKVFWIYGFSIQ